MDTVEKAQKIVDDIDLLIKNLDDCIIRIDAYKKSIKDKGSACLRIDFLSGQKSVRFITPQTMRIIENLILVDMEKSAQKMDIELKKMISQLP